MYCKVAGLRTRWSQKAFVRSGLGGRVFQIEEVASRKKEVCGRPVFLKIAKYFYCVYCRKVVGDERSKQDHFWLK